MDQYQQPKSIWFISEFQATKYHGNLSTNLWVILLTNRGRQTNNYRAWFSSFRTIQPNMNPTNLGPHILKRIFFCFYRLEQPTQKILFCWSWEWFFCRDMEGHRQTAEGDKEEVHVIRAVAPHWYWTGSHISAIKSENIYFNRSNRNSVYTLITLKLKNVKKWRNTVSTVRYRERVNMCMHWSLSNCQRQSDVLQIHRCRDAVEPGRTRNCRFRAVG